MNQENATPSRNRPSTLWLLVTVIAIVAVVLLEGFALSWGAKSTIAKPPHHHTITTIVQPGIRLCPTTTVQLIAVDYLRNPGFGEKPSVIGHLVKVHCGGPDDFQFNVQTAPLTLSLGKDAKIVLMNAEPNYFVGTLEQLNDYLSVDFDGNVFAVTGPDSDATGLIAEFHP